MTGVTSIEVNGARIIAAPRRLEIIVSRDCSVMPAHSRATPCPWQGAEHCTPSMGRCTTSVGNRPIVLSSHISPSLAVIRPASCAPRPTHTNVLMSFFFWLCHLQDVCHSTDSLLPRTFTQPRFLLPASVGEHFVTDVSSLLDALRCPKHLESALYTARNAYSPEACRRGSWSKMWCGQGDELLCV